MTMYSNRLQPALQNIITCCLVLASEIVMHQLLLTL